MKHGTHTQDRRVFLKSLAILAGSATLAPFIRVLPAVASSSLIQTSEQRILMGTFVNMTVLAPSRTLGQEAIGRAFEEVRRQIGIFDRFDSVTALSTLNQNGRLNGAPQELLDVVDFSATMSRHSGGRFDITIAPVVNLLERTHGKPDSKELREVLDLVNASGLRQNGNDLHFTSTGMAATLDGVAKGFIADRAAEVLMSHGVENFLIDAGGDICAQGSPEGLERPWRVAIEDPDKGGNYPSIINLRSGAVATSGGYEVFFDPKKKSHHLVNPSNGSSPQYIKSVSVQAPTVMQADGLATTLSLMSPREALRLTSSLPGHSCLLVTSTGARLASPEWS
ncbi:MAG: FAD:protein FMN transferase [Proteobacteria bacterium]|nr:FAD:protein FMN transferase [Pseudomonadota bacterium]